MQSEQQYYEGRNANTDPREQQQQQIYREYNTVEPGMAQEGGSKIHPQRPRTRRRGLWFLVVLLLVVTLAAAGGFQSVFSSSHNSLPAHTFTIAGQGKLVVNDGGGQVHIHSGDTSTITVQGTKHTYELFGNSNDAQVQEEQNGNTVTVSTQQGWNLFGSSDVDLDITVPSTTEVDVQDNSGDITIDNVSGPVKAHTGSGDIKANNLNGEVTLSTGSGDVHMDGMSGQIQASTGSGSIKTSGVSGQVTLSTGSGDIEMDQAKISGQSVLKTGSGSIHFNGSLDPTGTYQIQTGSGTVTLNLPTDSSFQLNTSTGSGSIHNDFDNSQVGTGLQASLSVKTGSGDINIQKQ
jgi:hypothetical protein